MLCFPDEEDNDDLRWSGGAMLMKNGDAYFTTCTTDENRQIRLKEEDESVAFVPVKIDALCGQKIKGTSLSFY